jgi:uncharacterized membrane protein YoaK (UPF0700 family)
MLAMPTAFVAGMVNIASLLIFFAFSSNVTGHYAILAAELVKGNWYQVAVVFGWIFLFFFGSFTSNFIVINFNKKQPYFAHALPLLLEMGCLLAVGIYGSNFYGESLSETEVLVALLLFAMGLQNGLTASISNFAVKTTHMTGATTDIGILASLFTRKEYRKNKELRAKAQLIITVMSFYILGGISAGFAWFYIGFALFYVIAGILLYVVAYDFNKIRLQALLGQLKKREAVTTLKLKQSRHRAA